MQFCASTHDPPIVGNYSRIFIMQCMDGKVRSGPEKNCAKVEKP